MGSVTVVVALPCLLADAILEQHLDRQEMEQDEREHDENVWGRLKPKSGEDQSPEFDLCPPGVIRVTYVRILDNAQQRDELG